MSELRQVLQIQINSVSCRLLLLLLFFFYNPEVPHLRGSFPWVRLGSGPLHPEGLYLGWGQGPTPSTAFGDRMGSSPPPDVEPVNITIGPQDHYQVSYLIPSFFFFLSFTVYNFLFLCLVLVLYPYCIREKKIINLLC